MGKSSVAHFRGKNSCHKRNKVSTLVIIKFPVKVKHNIRGSRIKNSYNLDIVIKPNILRVSQRREKKKERKEKKEMLGK